MTALLALGSVGSINRTVAISIESVEARRLPGKFAALNAAVAVCVERAEPRPHSFPSTLAIRRWAIESVAVGGTALSAAFFHRLSEFGAIDEAVAVCIESREALVVPGKLAAAEPAVTVLVGLANSCPYALPDLLAMFGAIRRIELSIAVSIEPLK